MWVWDPERFVSVVPSPQEMSMPDPTKLMVMLWSADAVFHVVTNASAGSVVSDGVMIYPYDLDAVIHRML